MGPKRKKWKLKEHSFTKMIVWFKDGRVRTFYSLDWQDPYSSTRNPRIGLERFERLMVHFGTKTKTIVIYDLQSGQPIAKYRNGVMVNPK